jgi:hypothetical protein
LVSLAYNKNTAMDFFDPKKQKRHAIRLGIGYALIGLALALATTILLYQAYGFGIDRNGKVIQNGLVFFSSHPAAADIYIGGARYKNQTNTRMVVPAGQYVVEMRRAGYQTWKRPVTVEGGSVERFDYPFLFPSSLATATTKQYAAAPNLATQSHDRRWLLVSTATVNEFDLYDLNAAKPVAKPVQVPADLLAAGSTTTSWKLVDWAGDNRHVVLQRFYQRQGQDGSEYILFDRQDPSQSQNLTVLLGFNPTAIALRDQNYDQYLAFDQVGAQVLTATLKKPTPQPYLRDVVGFTTDSNTVLYVTTQGAPDGKVLVRLRHGDDPSYTLRQAPAGTNYLLDLATYSGTPYVLAGAQNEDKVYVYKDPLAVLKGDAKAVPVPVQILKVTAPTYASFSLNSRMVMAENSDHFAVYDAETDKGYAFQTKTPLDAPQVHAEWMDGFRLSMISAGRLAVFDFDGTNQATLPFASPMYMPFFDHAYRYVYVLNTQNTLTATPLLAPKDL